jgi:DNA-binding FadR family transcriptional regulator
LVAPEAKPQTLKEHIAIIKAIRNRDPEAAGEAMRSHLSAALSRYHSVTANASKGNPTIKAAASRRHKVT